MPTNHNITITATTATPHPLTIKNDETGATTHTDPGDKNFTTHVNPGDTVTWKIAGDISAITAITENRGSENLFSVNPAKIAGTENWKGTVGSKPGGSEEEYTISYNVTNARNNPYSQDPKLKMNI